MARFSIDLSRITAQATVKAEVAVRRVMLEAFRSVVQMSPVDTGRFRANWVLGFGSPNRRTEEKFDRGGGRTISRIAAETAVAPVGAASVFFTNSLPYAARLEYGYSRQAAQGMVRVTLARLSAKYGV